jgi:hypothetical protein
VIVIQPVTKPQHRRRKQRQAKIDRICQGTFRAVSFENGSFAALDL